MDLRLPRSLRPRPHPRDLHRVQFASIRVTFTKVPDAPITKVIVNMQGGKKGLIGKGLIVNSTDIARKHRANAQLQARNGKRQAIKPVVRAGYEGIDGRAAVHRRGRWAIPRSNRIRAGAESSYGICGEKPQPPPCPKVPHSPIARDFLI